MLAGNPMLRNTTGESRGICHRCLFKDQTPFGGAPCTGNDTTSLPSHPCEGGIRTQGSQSNLKIYSEIELTYYSYVSYLLGWEEPRLTRSSIPCSLCDYSIRTLRRPSDNTPLYARAAAGKMPRYSSSSPAATDVRGHF